MTKKKSSPPMTKKKSSPPAKSSTNPLQVANNNAIQSCPSATAETNSLGEYTTNLCENYGNSVSQALIALNIPVCKYTTSQTSTDSTSAGVSSDWNESAGAGGSGFITGISSSMGGSISHTKSTTDTQTAIGCESVSVQSALNAQLTENLNCTLNQVIMSSDAYTQQGNDIQINLSNVTISGNFTENTNQTNTCTGKVANFANSDVQASLQVSVNMAAKSVASSLSNISATGIADPQGQLAFQNSVSSLNSLVSNNQIQNTVQNTIAQTCQKNKDGTSLSNVTVSGNVSLTLAQTNLNDYIISEIANSVMNTLNSSNVVTSVEQAQQAAQTEVTKGEWMGPNIFGNSVFTSWIFWVIIIVIVIGIIAGIYLYFTYGKKKTNENK